MKTTYKGYVINYDHINANGSCYSREALEKAVSEYQKKIKDGNSYGTVGFWDGNLENYSPSHKVTSLELTDKGCVAEIELLDNVQGKAFERLIESNLKFSLHPYVVGDSISCIFAEFEPAIPAVVNNGEGI